MSNINKLKVQRLRRQGKTYKEIGINIGKKIPKSSLSFWCKDIRLSDLQKQRIIKMSRKNLEIARKKAVATFHARRENRLNELRHNNLFFKDLLKYKRFTKK